MDGWDLSLTVEDCQYFRRAIFNLLYHAKDRTLPVWGVDVSTIIAKTNDGEDFEDFGRWAQFPNVLTVVAEKISIRLTCPEIKLVKAIARKEKHALREKGKLNKYLEKKAYARRQKLI